MAELSFADQALLDAIHQRFANSRLRKIPGVALMGHLIGKLLAMAERRGINWRAVVVANLPTSIEVARRTWGLTDLDEQAIRFSEEHSAEYVTDMAVRMKEQVRDVVTESLSHNAPPADLSRRLLEEYGTLNRDWRRIAITETATAVSNGYLAQQDPGSLVVGDSAVDCCDWCREHLQGWAYRMLDGAPAEPTDEESLTCVWVGKTNVGRSKYPTRKDGTARPTSEVWHPCIPSHPHCRCRWRQFNSAIDVIEAGSNKVTDRFNVWE